MNWKIDSLIGKGKIRLEKKIEETGSAEGMSFLFRREELAYKHVLGHSILLP